MRPAAAAVALGMLAGCASTTYDASLAATTPKTEVPTTLPSGPPEVILPRMLAEAQSLSPLILDRGDDGAVMTQIDEDWRAVQNEVRATHPELVPAFEDAVRTLTAASKLNRAADADKAAKNLQVLIEHYLA